MQLRYFSSGEFPAQNSLKGFLSLVDTSKLSEQEQDAFDQAMASLQSKESQ
jgi:hypothetical protein